MYRKGVGGHQEVSTMLGIDVSKDTLSCTLFDPTTQQPRWAREVPNTAVGVARLLRLTPHEVPWALEPTGRYSQAVARTACAAGQEYCWRSPTQSTWSQEVSGVAARAGQDRPSGQLWLGLVCSQTQSPALPTETAYGGTSRSAIDSPSWAEPSDSQLTGAHR